MLFLLYADVSASEFIDVEVAEPNINLNQNLVLEIVVNASEIWVQSIEFQIPGIENFDIFSRQQSEQYQNINGEVRREILYSLGLVPLSEWSFEIWPVTLLNTSEEIEDDEIITVNVWSQALQNSRPSLPENTWEENIEWVQEDSDIRGLRIPETPLWMWGIMLVLFFMSFYIVLSFLFENKKQWDTQKEQEHTKEQDAQRIQKYFIDLRTQIWILSSKDFFRRYNVWVREMLFEAWYDSAKTDTLSELSRHKNIGERTEFHLLKKSYIYEFDETQATKKTQKKFIDDILITFD